MNTLGKICPFMSSKMNYQHCIEECAFYDEYVGCLIKFDLSEISNTSTTIQNTVHALYEKTNN